MKIEEWKQTLGDYEDSKDDKSFLVDPFGEKFCCNECGTTFELKSELRKHLKREHKQPFLTPEEVELKNELLLDAKCELDQILNEISDTSDEDEGKGQSLRIKNGRKGEKFGLLRLAVRKVEGPYILQ